MVQTLRDGSFKATHALLPRVDYFTPKPIFSILPFLAYFGPLAQQVKGREAVLALSRVDSSVATASAFMGMPRPSLDFVVP
jgi:hypothetical protein